LPMPGRSPMPPPGRWPVAGSWDGRAPPSRRNSAAAPPAMPPANAPATLPILGRPPPPPATLPMLGRFAGKVLGLLATPGRDAPVPGTEGRMPADGRPVPGRAAMPGDDGRDTEPGRPARLPPPGRAPGPIEGRCAAPAGRDAGRPAALEIDGRDGLGRDAPPPGRAPPLGRPPIEGRAPPAPPPIEGRAPPPRAPPPPPRAPPPPARAPPPRPPPPPRPSRSAFQPNHTTPTTRRPAITRKVFRFMALYLPLRDRVVTVPVGAVCER
jgi:hypothetical protein